MQDYLVLILHSHEGESSTTTGKLKAENEEDAEKRSISWVERKLDEHGCERDGNHCALGLSLATGRRSLALSDAEEIITSDQG